MKKETKIEKINIQKYINKNILVTVIFTLLNIVCGIYVYKNMNNIFTNSNIWIEKKETNIYVYELLIPKNTVLNKIKKINEKLTKKYKTKSFLNEIKWYMEGDKTSNILKETEIKNIITKKTEIKKYEKKYKNYFTNKDIIFYFQNTNKDIKDIKEYLTKEKIKYKIINYYKQNNKNITNKIKEVIFIYILIIILLKIIFKSFSTGINLSLISITTILLSISIIHIIYPKIILDIKLFYIIIVISIVDYMYFYYRYSIFLKEQDQEEALIHSVLSNYKPAFLTTLIILIILIPLILLKYKILIILTNTIIITSIVAFIINLLLFPILTNFFQGKCIKNFYYFTYTKIKFLDFLIKNNNKLTKIIITISTIIITIFLYYFITNKYIFFYQKNNANVLIMTIKKNSENNKQAYIKYKNLNALLKIYYPENKNIKTYSIVNEIDEINKKNDIKINNINQYIDHNSFILDFNNIKSYKNQDKNNIYIYGLTKKQKIEILNNKNIKNIYKEIDVNSLITINKYNSSYYLSISIIFSILLISIFLGWYFKNKKIFIYSFITNFLPIILFAWYIYYQKINISMNLYIVVFLSLILSVDNIVHLNYRYWKSRKIYKYNQKKALQETYLFSILPMVISTIILFIIFLSIIIFNNEIEYYIFSTEISIILLFSLLTDMFFYPIFLINADKT